MTGVQTCALPICINPGLYSAATGHHFARPGSRFWPALHRSGLTSRRLHPSEQEQLLEAGLGSRTSSPGPRRELTGSIRPGCARVALRWPRKWPGCDRSGWRSPASPLTGPRSADPVRRSGRSRRRSAVRGYGSCLTPAASMRTGARRPSRQSSPGCERRPTSRSEAPACVKILLRNYNFAACLSRMRTTSGATLRPSPRRQPGLCLQLPPARAGPPWLRRGGPGQRGRRAAAALASARRLDLLRR